MNLTHQHITDLLIAAGEKLGERRARNGRPIGELGVGETLIIHEEF